MLPSYPLSYQPYFLFPSLLSSGNPIIYHNNQPYIIQSFQPQIQFHKLNSNKEGINHLQTAFPSHIQPFYKVQSLNRVQNQNLSKTQNKAVKEKIIKKPANRPSTYLTERKYYLAQTLSSQKHSQRILRPKYQKKKSSKSKENLLLRKQHVDFQLQAPLLCIKEEEINLKEQFTLQKQKLSQLMVLKQEYNEEQGQVEDEEAKRMNNEVPLRNPEIIN